MHTFMPFNSGEAYAYSAMVREWIYGEKSLYDVDDFFDCGNTELLNKALLPSKWTLLHHFIEDAIYMDMEYVTRKAGELVLGDLCKLLDNYEVSYKSKQCFNADNNDYADYIFEKVQENALKRLAAEVFNLLFADRGLLKAFNACIAQRVREMELADHPTYLSRDGVFIRCNYWPSWLKDGLVRRDKGHCAICQCDLSGHLAREAEVHIDHIIPLNLGGVNDPSNLQLLCDFCNGTKGGDKTTTTEMVANYW